MRGRSCLLRARYGATIRTPSSTSWRMVSRGMFGSWGCGFMNLQDARAGATIPGMTGDETWIGGKPGHDAPVTLVEYDRAWPALYEREAERIRSLLGERVLRLEHVGSTSVPELVAKPIIDILLVVAEPADEPAYVPALESGGYVLRIREP